MNAVRQKPVTIVISTLAIGVGMFAGSFGQYFVPIQIGAFIDGLGYSASQSGMLGAVEVGSMSLTAILISSKLSTWSRSRTAICGVVFASTCELLTGFVSSLTLLFPLRILVGVGCGFVFASICAAAATSHAPDRIFGWGQAVMNCLFLLMFLLLPHTLNYGIHKGLFVTLAIVQLMTISLIRFLPNASGEVLAEQSTEKKASVVLIATHIVAVVLLNIGLGALWGFVERVGSEQVGLTAETIGKVLSMATLFMIGGSLFAAWLGVRIGRAIPTVIAAVLCAVASISVMSAETLVFYAGGLFLYNAAYLFIGPYIIAGISSELDPSGRLAAAVGGVMFLSYSVGIGTGGFIAELISLTGIGILALCTCLIAAPLFAIVSTRLKINEGQSK
ncbi:MAG: MFS family permease [Planctomycetota bacterium]